MKQKLAVTQTCPAKINIFLHVLGKRDDGYHEILSLAAFTSFADRLSLSIADKSELLLSGPYATALEQAGGDSIISRLKSKLENSGTSLPHLTIQIEKNIPLGGGLGGGSANGAAFLKALMQAELISLDPAQLNILAREVGADIPVCLRSGLQVMEGVGEALTSLRLPKNLPYCVLANPNQHVSTWRVFSSLKIKMGTASPSLDEIQHMVDCQEWRQLISSGNHLQEPALECAPQIGILLAEMELLGHKRAAGEFFGAAMSGSGASCFAFFEAEEDADRLSLALKDKGYWAVSTRVTPD